MGKKTKTEWPMTMSDVIDTYHPHLGKWVQDKKRSLVEKFDYIDTYLSLEDRKDSTCVQGMVSLAEYVECGRQNFCVGPKMQELLAHTRLNIDRVDLPYESFFIGLPECGLSISGSEVFGVLVTKFGERLIKELGDADRHAFAQRLREMGAGDKIDIQTCFDPDAPTTRGFSLHTDRFKASGKKTLEQFIRSSYDDKINARIPDVMLEVGLIALNLCAYLGAEGAETRKERHPVDVLKNLGKPAKKKGLVRTVVWVGDSLEEHAKREAESPGSSHASPIQHWVRGHWRKPNARMKEQRLVWVKPHKRGSEDGGRVEARLYRMLNKQ